MTSIVARRKFPVIDQLYSHLQQFWSKLRRVLPEPIKTRWISLHDGESSSFLERIRFPRTRFSRTLVYFDPFSSRAKLDPISSQLEILLSLRVVRTSAVIKILYFGVSNEKESIHVRCFSFIPVTIIYKSFVKIFVKILIRLILVSFDHYRLINLSIRL